MRKGAVFSIGGFLRVWVLLDGCGWKEKRELIPVHWTCPVNTPLTSGKRELSARSSRRVSQAPEWPGEGGEW